MGTVPSPDDSLQSAVLQAGHALRDAISAMLEELANTGMREQRAIGVALDLSQSSTSQLMSCVRVADPLATLSRVPGPQGLRKMLRGAARAGVGAACLQRVEAAINGVEKLIDEDVGDRDALDSLLSDWLLESRGGFEVRQKSMIFKGFSALRGVQARIQAVTWIVYPSAEPGLNDAVLIDGLYGCRRIRPNAVLHTTTRHLSPEPHRFSVLSLDRRPIESAQDMVVPDFTTANLDAIQSQRSGTLMQLQVPNLPLGKGAGTDLVTAQLFERMYRNRRGPDSSPTTGAAAHVEPPALDLVFDALIHDDVWSDVQPELRIFDTAIRGLAHPDDPIRQADRLDTLESIVFLGRGLATFRIADLPHYTQLVTQVCTRVGCDAERLRGYRCRIHYPVYGTQICLAFRLPEPR